MKIILSILILVFYHTTTFAADLRIIHVIVALCDNEYQGIVPVPEKIGNGDDPFNNLYWGAAYGTKTYLKRSTSWKLLSSSKMDNVVLERCIFRSNLSKDFLIADAYRGREIRQAIMDFIGAAAGKKTGYHVTIDGENLGLFSDADLIAYVGHDGLMDFQLPEKPSSKDGRSRNTAVLACMSKQFFGPYLESCNANPILLTTNLMAPEAYVLDALDRKWIEGGTKEDIRQSAAAAYSKYQRCSQKAALQLFTNKIE